MFPLPWNKTYRKKDGSLTTLDDAIQNGGGGGGGGSFTPDYENDILIIGEHGDYKYYIPMEKEYIGPGIHGYEIETDPASSSSLAVIDLYKIIYQDGEILSKVLIKKLTHNVDPTYSDDNISISYVGTKWTVTFDIALYDENGEAYTSPLEWGYATPVDYVMLLEDPT